MKKLGFYPNIKITSNPYTTRIIEAIKFADPDLIISSFEGSKKDFFNSNFDIVWLNWYENLPLKTIPFFKILLKKIFLLISLKIKKKKIITVFHNKKPHESKFPKINNWFFRFLLNKSNVIVILNEDSRKIVKDYIQKKKINIVKISHPSYSCFPKINKNIELNKFSILFFGNLRPYKNIELIIKLAEEFSYMNFIIAGNPITKEYEEKILKLTKGLKNIELHLGFISDNMLDKLIEKSTILVLPYNLSSSLNSGVLYFALSKKINVIIPLIGSISDIKNKDDIYTYLYNQESEKDHYLNLKNAVLEAYADYMYNNVKFEEKINRLHKEIIENNSPKKIGQIINKLNILNTYFFIC